MSKLTEEDKAEIIKHYLNSLDGYKATADKFGINKGTVRMIILRYQQSGSLFFCFIHWNCIHNNLLLLMIINSDSYKKTRLK